MIKFSLFSDKGSRENNEDNVGMYQDGEAFCFLLADGLGGHGKGEVASQLAVETSVGRFSERAGEGGRSGATGEAISIRANRADQAFQALARQTQSAPRQSVEFSRTDCP